MIATDSALCASRYGKLLHVTAETMWNNWADFCGNRMSTKNPDYAAEQGRPVGQEQDDSTDKEL
eukprot:COSAG02_NODE_1147_length_14223_cov_4.760337_2_plen_64_part_00